MIKTCVKCGHTQTIKSINSLTECPKCGVIHAKAEAKPGKITQDDKQEIDGLIDIQEKKSPSVRISTYINLLVIGVIASLFLYHYCWHYPVEKQEEQVVQQTVEQKDEIEPIGTGQMETLPDDDADLALIEEQMEVPEIQESVEPTVLQNSIITPVVQDSIVIPLAERLPEVITPKKIVNNNIIESTISQGEEVNLTEHISEGRYTVFFFYADW